MVRSFNRKKIREKALVQKQEDPGVPEIFLSSIITTIQESDYLRAPAYFIGTQAPSCLLLATHC